MSLEASTEFAEAPAAPVADAPAPAPAETVHRETPEVDSDQAWDDELRSVYRNANRARDESGKFVGKDGKSVEEAPEQIEAKAPEETKPIVPAIEPPRTWQGDLKDKFAALPPEVQKIVAEREAEAQEVRTAAGRLTAEYSPIRETLSKHADYLGKVGQPLDQYLDRVISISHQLDNGNAAGVIQELAKAYKVDLFALADPFAAPAQVDPQIATLQQEVQQLRAHIEQQQRTEQNRQRQAQENERTQVLSVVDEFLSRVPDVKGYEAELEAQIAAARRAAPDLAPKDLIQKAWETVVWSNEKLRAARLEADRKAQAEAAHKAARQAQNAASVNARGAPKPAADGEDLDADLRAVWRKNNR